MEKPFGASVTWNVQVFDGIALATAGDAIVVLWNAPSRVERIRWVFSQAALHLRACPEGVVVLQMILQSASPPDAEGRAENKRGLDLLGGRLRRLVTVPLGDDLWASVVRMVMRGMFMLQGQSQKLTVSDSVHSGIAQLGSVATARTPNARELDAGVGALFVALGLARRG